MKKWCSESLTDCPVGISDTGALGSGHTESLLGSTESRTGAETALRAPPQDPGAERLWADLITENGSFPARTCLGWAGERSNSEYKQNPGRCDKVWTVLSGLWCLRSTADLHADSMQGPLAQRHGLPWIKKKMPTTILVHPQGSRPWCALSDSCPLPRSSAGLPRHPRLSSTKVLLILPLYLAKVQEFLSSSPAS